MVKLPSEKCYLHEGFKQNATFPAYCNLSKQFFAFESSWELFAHHFIIRKLGRGKKES